MHSMVSFAQLMKLGRTLVSDRVPEQSRQSLPIPTRTGESHCIAFMYSPARALPNLVKLAPPHFVACLNTAGTLAELRPVTPQVFGQPHRAGDLLGEFSLPPGMTANGYLTRRDHLFALYERLVPVWFENPRAAHTDLRTTAAEFLREFAALSEPPLTPYYESLGREFFGWVRLTAQ